MKYKTAFLVMGVILLLSCTKNANDIEKTGVLLTFNLLGDNVNIYKSPSMGSEKVSNENGLIILNKTDKVTILEEVENWKKIQLVDNQGRKATAVGWIPNHYIITEENAIKKEPPVQHIDKSKYVVLRQKKVEGTALINFYIMIRDININEKEIELFIDSFRKEFANDIDSNIYLYDTNEVLPLLEIYPLPDKEYLFVADHFVAMSSFDAPELVFLYPYQDFHYKEIGGKNWKKDKIE